MLKTELATSTKLEHFRQNFRQFQKKSARTEGWSTGQSSSLSTNCTAECSNRSDVYGDAMLYFTARFSLKFREKSGSNLLLEY